MDVRDWLSLVAARNGSSSSGAKHYHGFAASIRREFHRLPCSEASAHAVASILRGEFPTWDALRNAIRAVLEEVDQSEGSSPEARMTSAWIGFYRRRVKESPEQQFHLLSLLRKVDMDAFLAVDGGAWSQREAEFDRQFWAERGGRKHHPANPNVVVETMRATRPPAIPGPAESRHVAYTPPRRTAAPRHLTPDQLAQHRALASETAQ